MLGHQSVATMTAKPLIESKLESRWRLENPLKRFVFSNVADYKIKCAFDKSYV